MRVKDWSLLLLFVALSEGAGLVGSIFTAPAIDSWYTSLVLPAVAPPNWIFAPVWTTLFLLMGVAAFLVWRAEAKQTYVRAALGVFAVQLVLNVLWSYIFFGLHNPGAAFVEIMFLWLLIALNIWAFSKVSKLAAWLLVPYIGWVTFAAYLNYLIWTLNSSL